jgi:hypothetical protein
MLHIKDWCWCCITDQLQEMCSAVHMFHLWLACIQYGLSVWRQIPPIYDLCFCHVVIKLFRYLPPGPELAREYDQINNITRPTSMSHYSKLIYLFMVCTSVHHTIQITCQPEATIIQFLILIFIYSSTRFGRSWSGRSVGPTTNTARLSPRYEVKTRGWYCSHWAPDDGRENARNVLSCKSTSG